ncbi:NDMA-dependent alcohol dehydrogenase [Pseudonocardia halophobica]|uniref:Alcohol dehydrogenase D n=1 Tax=Pseudonocardia halophobica TaxID=29401 RepID=A0A9W6KYU4_9PSEU|nr:alcohol dehydrogenase catalytic domain-containing protein [Pseudonocardia halophobica]GLL10516.1 putative alcohol dehydrogenase D [Pseudonocardia halophobica]
MQVQASILTAPGKSWETATLDLADPKEGEVLVRVEVAGLCHSDDHLRHAGSRYPIVGGHEGAGVVEAVGAGVTHIKAGDHVLPSVVPSCGRCRYCTNGRSFLCDLGETVATGALFDGTFRYTLGSEGFGGFCLLGTFADHMVTPQESLIVMPKDVPFDVAALLSCGVPTGWGSAVYAAGARAGETVVVVGVGGVGINAVQGAALAGASHIVALDPVESRREFATTLGATHTASTVDEAADLARTLTAGTGADATIVTAGVVTSDVIDDAVAVTGKGGRIVLTGVADDPQEITINLSGTMVTSYGYSLIGALVGNCNVRHDIPKLIRLYREGKLEVEKLISKRYTVDQVQEAYDDQAAGTIIRGVLEHRH